MMNKKYQLKIEEELSQVTGGGVGADIVVGALSGAYQVVLVL